MMDFAQIKASALKAIEDIQDEKSLESLRVEYFGKKGILVQCLQQLEQVPPKEKPVIGKAINELKKEILAKLEQKSLLLAEQQLALKLNQEKIDVSLPGRSQELGSLHPVTYVRREIEKYFKTLGFDIISGPEVETEFYNFEALNIPTWHPARAMHDTFYFDDGNLLRTHTSPVQIRSMLEGKPPFRLIAPGRVYRCDYDMTHTPMFHQVEGLMIDKDITLSGLKNIFLELFKFLFNKDIAVRFRPSYFPFTEPSAELDIACTNCNGAGCRSCKFTGWLEVLGCGMVHPQVLNKVNIPTDYQGWAFGMGIDRIAMLYYGIDDLRTLFENDIKFLRQF